MKRLTIALGFGCCALGCLLYAVNWLGAILYVPYVTMDVSSVTETGRLHAAQAQVGHQPFIIGVVLFAIGLLVIVVSLLARNSAPVPSEAASETRPPADGSV